MTALVCPFLGQRDDPSTVYYYPSATNHCHGAVPVKEVDLDHQQEFCLSGDFPECPWFPGVALTSKDSPEEGFTRPEPASRARHKFHFWYLIYMILIVLAGGLWLAFSQPVEGDNTYLNLDPPTPATQVAEYTQIPSQTPGQPSALFTMFVPTSTLLALHGLEVPIGIQNPLVIHLVGNGEDLSNLAAKYNTTEQAIESINFQLKLPLKPGAVVVIPLNQTDVNELPAFEPCRVDQEVVLSALASRFTVQTGLLGYYNQVGQDYEFQVGDWVLIPHPRSTTPAP